MARAQDAQPVVGGSVNPMAMGSAIGRNNRMLEYYKEDAATARAAMAAGVQREGIAAQRAMQAEELAQKDRTTAAIEQENRLNRETELRRDEYQRAHDKEMMLARDELQKAKDARDEASRQKAMDRFEEITNQEIIGDLIETAMQMKAAATMSGHILGRETSLQKWLTAVKAEAENARIADSVTEGYAQDAQTLSASHSLLTGTLPAEIGRDPITAVNTAFREISKGIGGPDLTWLDFSVPDRLAEAASQWDYNKFAATVQTLRGMRGQIDKARSGASGAAAERLTDMLTIVDDRLSQLLMLKTSKLPGKAPEGHTGPVPTLGQTIGGYYRHLDGITTRDISRKLQEGYPDDPEGQLKMLNQIINMQVDPNEMKERLKGRFPPELVQKVFDTFGGIYGDWIDPMRTMQEAAQRSAGGSQ